VNTRIKELIKNSTWKGISSPLHSASMDQRSRGKNRAAASRVENREAENKAFIDSVLFPSVLDSFFFSSVAPLYL